MANTDWSDSGVGLNDDIIARGVITGYTETLAPWTTFSTSFNADAARPGDKIKILRDNATIDPVQTKAIGGAYTIQDADGDVVQIDLGSPKYVSWGLDDVEVQNSSVLALDIFGRRKGQLLAKSVLQDFMSDITAANFADNVVSTSAAFDEDVVADIAEECDSNDMPQEGRTLHLSPAYIAALRKSGAIKDTSGYGFDAIMSGNIPMLHGFRVLMLNYIPDNGENLVGFASHPTAMAAAIRYNAPQSGNKYEIAEPIVGEGDVTLGRRVWYSEDYGNRRAVFDTIYGKAPALPNGIVRLASA